MTGAKGDDTPDDPRPQDATPPSNGAIVRFEGVRKSFGKTRVLGGIDVAFQQGQTTVVLGPSGAGKSVLLKHIVGLLRPDAGAVYFRDLRVDKLPERDLGKVRREIGFLFQLSALFDSMTVLENVEFPLVEHTGLTARQRRDKVVEALERVDLHAVLDRLPVELSGGQKKRVGLARAIILDPTVILYDEPTTGLDPIRAAGINDLIVRLQETLGVTSIVVTHDMVTTQRVADRVILLHDARIIADGSMDELRASRDPIVQGFLSGREEEFEIWVGDDGRAHRPQEREHPSAQERHHGSQA